MMEEVGHVGLYDKLWQTIKSHKWITQVIFAIEIPMQFIVWTIKTQV